MISINGAINFNDNGIYSNNVSMKVSVSGVRGVFPSDLNLEHVIAYVRAFSYLALNNSCVLAYDARISSKLISKVASAVLRSKGLDVYNLGIMPTPVLVRESRERKSIGIMVTASHNPLSWNGIKFIINGRGIFDEELKEILSRVNEGKESVVMHNNGNNKSNNIGIGREYIMHSTNYIRDSIQFINDNIKGINVAARPRVVIDASIGTVKGYMQEILFNIGFKDIVVIDSNEPDPTVRSLTELKMHTSSNGIGFAFDSDADRLVVVNKGKVLSPDDTLLLCIATIISNRGYDSITVSVDTSNSIRDLASSYNCKVCYAKVGEANVVKSMLNNNSIIGGEGSSAGFIMSNFNSCRDAILASMLILKAYEHIDKILKEYSRYHTKRGKVSISTDIDVNKVIEGIVSKEHDYSEHISIDGAKFIIDEHTWVLVRGSNTEHAIRLSVESISKDKADTLYRIYEDKILEACKDARGEGYN